MAKAKGGEGFVEKLARAKVAEGIGVFALAAAGVVLLPPAGAAVAMLIGAGELASVLPAKLIQDRQKKRRINE